MIYNTNLPRFVLLFVLLMIGMTSTAQKLKESVILYNLQPVRALIDENGNIVKIIAYYPDYLSNQEIDVPEYDRDIRNIPTDERIVPSVAEDHENEIVLAKDKMMTLHFDHDMAVLSSRVRKELDVIVEVLKTNPGIKIEALTLSLDDNELVSKNRQNSVRAYLKIRGISENRFSFKSYFSDIETSEVKIQFLGQ